MLFESHLAPHWDRHREYHSRSSPRSIIITFWCFEVYSLSTVPHLVALSIISICRLASTARSPSKAKARMSRSSVLCPECAISDERGSSHDFPLLSFLSFGHMQEEEVRLSSSVILRFAVLTPNGSHLTSFIRFMFFEKSEIFISVPKLRKLSDNDILLILIPVPIHLHCIWVSKPESKARINITNGSSLRGHGDRDRRRCPIDPFKGKALCLR
jgi:hypothetical protein